MADDIQNKVADLGETLDTVDISDTNLAVADKETKAEQKLAKKRAKKLQTPKEKRRIRLQRGLLVTATVVSLMLVLLLIPVTRWSILNTLGFRGVLQLTITSNETKKPVKSANVRVVGHDVRQTDEFGRVAFQNVRLGKRQVSIQKPGYSEETLQVTNTLGSTKRTLSIKVVGIKLDFDIKNWLTGAPIEGASVKLGDEQSDSDKTGRATIVVPPTDSKKIEVVVSAPGYASKTVSAEIDVESREVTLVSNQKNYFMSRRDGKFDLFSSNLDGSEQKKLVEATGKEDGNIMQLTIHKSNKHAILVANREGKVASGKFVAGVYVLDLEKASLRKVDEGSDIQLLGWFENTIMYTKTVPSLAYDDPAATQLQSYTTTTNKLATVTQANYFATALIAQNKVFYVPADPYRELTESSLTSFDLQSGAKKTYLSGTTIRYGGRVSYQSLEFLDTNSSSYELQIASGAIKVVDRKNITSVIFSMSPNNQLATWTDVRDGQGTLLVKNIKNNDEKVIVKMGGLINPVRFVSDDLVVVRVVTSQESADYVVSLSTLKMAKIVDVSNIGAMVRQGL